IETSFLCVFFNSHASAVFEETTGLTTGHAQLQFLGHLVKVPSNSCIITVYETLQFLHTPVMASGYINTPPGKQVPEPMRRSPSLNNRSFIDHRPSLLVVIFEQACQTNLVIQLGG